MAKSEKQELASETTIVHSKRRYLRVGAFVVFGLSLALLLVWNLSLSTPSVPEEVKDTQFDSVVDKKDEPYTLSRELPTYIKIPSINVEAMFDVPLDLNPDQTITVPDDYDKVGWYKLGAAPGEMGTAAILGHVDSREGPAVFFSLGQLSPGDSIYITRADGSEAEFIVEYLERYKQEEFPTEKVYGQTSYPSLRLITCTGTFKKGEQRYTHNLVVYARLVKPLL